MAAQWTYDAYGSAASIAIGLIPGGKLAAKGGALASKFISRFAGRAAGLAEKYAVKAGKFLWNKGKGIVSRAGKWLARGCGCFEADTEVWTTRGLVPIGEVTTDDEVLAQDEATGELSWRSVIRTFVRKGAPIVAVTLMGTANAAPLASPDGMEQSFGVATQPSGEFTLNTTEEHPFLVDCGWVQAGQLKPGDAVRTVDGSDAIVLSVAFTNRTAEVFNLEVVGLHDYHVGPDGVVVHNESPCLLWLKVLTDRGARIKNTEAWFRTVADNLVRHHGGNAYDISNAIHRFKNKILGGAENVYIDLTGSVYHPETGEILGNLLER